MLCQLHLPSRVFHPAMTAVDSAARAALLLAVCALSLALPARAGTITVTSLADDGGSGELRAAIYEANQTTRSTIVFQNGLLGTIAITSALPQITLSTTIQGPGASVIAVNGGGSYRCFSINDPSGYVTISGLSILGGSDKATNAGGAGCYVAAGSLTLSNCILANNIAGENGGAIYNYSGTVSLSNCTLSGNSAFGTAGGGAICNNGTLTLTDCTISSNSAAGDGGGAIANEGATATLTGCNITDNLATANVYGGGAINVEGGTVSLTDCTLSANTACCGGAIYDSGSVGLTNCTLIANVANGSNGGGVYSAGAATLTNCTFTDNVANGNGSGVAGSASLSNCILYGDIGSEVSTSVNAAYCDIEGTYPGTGNISSNPYFVTDGLAYNGGPTPTVALLDNSPCYGVAVNAPAADQRGITRPSPSSIGAYDAGTPIGTVPTPTFTPNGGTVPASQLVNVTDTQAGVTIFYNTLGSPSTLDSTLYTGAFPLLNSETIEAFAVAPGYANSAVGSVTLQAIPAPVVNDVSPGSGPLSWGTPVTITGTNYSPGATVDFGTVAATQVIVVSPTSITCKAPANAAGVVDVTVTTAGGLSATSPADRYAYDPIPSVSGVEPPNGPVSGGTAVTVSGTGFVSGATVDFGKTVASKVAVTSATTLTCVSPPGSTGTVDVVVNTPGGSSTVSPSDEFAYGQVPKVTSISPVVGPLLGGTSVQITGSTFAGATAVTFGAIGAKSFVVNSNTSITAVSPKGSAGSVNVTVTNVGGTSETTSADEFVYLPSPTVLSVSPSNGPTRGGTAITITGTGFYAGSTVTFGGVPATNVLVSSEATLSCTAPAGSAGQVTVVVTTPVGTSPASSLDRYTYVAPPVVTAISPSAGPLSGGGMVTISGTNLANATEVEFGKEAAATVASDTSTAIKVAVPPGSAGTVNIAVSTVGGTNVASAAATYTYLPPPTVSKVVPSSGPLAGNTSVTITGAGFTTASTVTFGSVVAKSVVVNGTTSITAKSPAESSGTVTVAVTTVGGTSTKSSTSQFVYLPAPSVASISPNDGPLAGGATVTVKGTGFVAGASVSFGTSVATNVSVTSSTALTCKCPAGAVGTVNVTVTTAGGASGSSPVDQFTFVAPPSVTSVSPKSGPAIGHTVVTITGTNLANTTQVYFGTVPVTSFSSDTSTAITLAAPAEAAETVDVTVKTAGGTSATSTADQFTYLPNPSVSAVSPNAGPIGGNTRVTIAGAGFVAGATVKFGTIAASSVLVNSATSITAVSPTARAGTVNIVVTTAVGTSANTAADQFTYLGVPTVTGISPPAGYPAGGSTVYVGGTNFFSDATVTFEGVPAMDVTYLNATTLTCVSPAESPGTVDIVVTTAGGKSATSPADQFSYLAVPTVTSVSPTSGPTAGNTKVTIKGTAFLAGSTVTFGSSSALNVTVVSPTTITCTSPPATASGTVDVTVTTEGGTSAPVAADKFKYVAPS